MLLIVPFHSSIAIASHKVRLGLRLPPQPCAREIAFARCVPDIENFSFVDIIQFDLSIGAADGNHFVVVVDLECEGFRVNISEEIDDPALRKIAVDELYFARIKVLLLLDLLLLFQVFLYLTSWDWFLVLGLVHRTDIYYSKGLKY